MADLTGAVWHKSARSGGNGGDCVEVAINLPGIVAVRDSKDRGGTPLVFPDAAWTAFLHGVRSGEFDLSRPRPGRTNSAPGRARAPRPAGSHPARGH